MNAGKAQLRWLLLPAQKPDYATTRPCFSSSTPFVSAFSAFGLPTPSYLTEWLGGDRMRAWMGNG